MIFKVRENAVGGLFAAGQTARLFGNRADIYSQKTLTFTFAP
jgi:hypothetical protein